MLTGILGLHSVTGASAAQFDGGGAPLNDAFLSSVKLLCGFNGADGATSTSDESPAAHGAATFAGNVQLDTAQKKFGTASMLFDGTGDYIHWPDSADWTLGTGAFTIEAFVRFAGTAGFQTIICQWAESLHHSFIFDFTSNTLRLGLSATSSGSGTFTQQAWTPSLNTWYHVCAERTGGGTVRLYVDGTMLGTAASNTTNAADQSTNLTIGGLSPTDTPGNYFNGWIDEVRITKGVARYASDSGFTVPSAAYPRT